MKALLVLVNSDVVSTKKLLGALKENVPPNFLKEWVMYFGVEPGNDESGAEVNKVKWAATVLVQFKEYMGVTWGINSLAAQAFQGRAVGIAFLETSMVVAGDYLGVSDWYLGNPKGAFMDMGGAYGGSWTEFAQGTKLSLEGGLVVSRESWHRSVQRNWDGRPGWKESISRWVKKDRAVFGVPSVARSWPGAQERDPGTSCGKPYYWKA